MVKTIATAGLDGDEDAAIIKSEPYVWVGLESSTFFLCTNFHRLHVTFYWNYPFLDGSDEVIIRGFLSAPRMARSYRQAILGLQPNLCLVPERKPVMRASKVIFTALVAVTENDVCVILYF